MQRFFRKPAAGCILKLVLVWLAAGPNVVRGADRGASPSRAAGTVGDSADASSLLTLSAPYVLLSLHSLDRTLQIVTTLLEPIHRDDVLDTWLDEMRDEGVNCQDLPGVNTGRPVGYLLTLRSHWGLSLSAGADTSDDSVPDATGEVAGQDHETQVEAIGAEIDADGQIVTTSGTVPASRSDDDTSLWETLFSDPALLLFASIHDRQAAKGVLESTLTPGTSLRPVQESTELFQAVSAESQEVELLVRLVGDDVYISDEDDLPLLEQFARLKTSPVELAARYDVQASLQFDHLPTRMRDQLSNALWRAAAPGLQQRDAESTVDFAYRDATSRSLVDIATLLIRGVREVTAGADLIDDEEVFRTCIELAAVDDSELKRRLTKLDGPPSLFLPLHDPDAALSLSMSIRLSKQEQELLTRWVRWLKAEVMETSFHEDEALRNACGQMCDSLLATIDAGLLDFYLQFEVEDAGSFGLHGGLRLAQLKSFQTGLSTCLDWIRRDQDLSAGSTSTDAGSETWNDLTLEHVRYDQELSLANDVQADVDITVAVGRGALWFAGGVCDSRARLKSLLERQKQGRATDDRGAAEAPAWIRINANEWQSLPLNSKDFDQRIHREVAEEAFASRDRAELELRPTRNGVRLVGRFDRGFMRWLALLWALEHDQSHL
ncbi:MAG: hypothetical protein ACK5Q5_19645 [Planctomycetaceae bacterium]